MENNTNLIKNIVEEILKKLTVNFDSIDFFEDGNRFCIKSDDSSILIGSEGNNIKALNHIIKQIVFKKQNPSERGTSFFVDVNDYQENNIERIKREALETAEKAIVFKRDIEMKPMSSFERMIVHSALAENENVSTESEGEGTFRKVVIKYKSNN